MMLLLLLLLLLLQARAGACVTWSQRGGHVVYGRRSSFAA
jgi:hypothetical protein